MSKISKIICYGFAEFFLILASMLIGAYIVVNRVGLKPMIIMTIILILLSVLLKILAEEIK